MAPCPVKASLPHGAEPLPANVEMLKGIFFAILSLYSLSFRSSFFRPGLELLTPSPQSTSFGLGFYYQICRIIDGKSTILHLSSGIYYYIFIFSFSNLILDDTIQLLHLACRVLCEQFALSFVHRSLQV
jgi:hypothetical protein